MSLKYIDSNYQSVALNLVPAVVFVLALIFQQEKLMLFSMNGQIKILGLLISIGGALLLILWKGPVLLGSHFIATQDTIFGILLIIVAVLASGFWNVVVVITNLNHSKFLILFCFFFYLYLTKR